MNPSVKTTRTEISARSLDQIACASMPYNQVAIGDSLRSPHPLRLSRGLPTTTDFSLLKGRNLLAVVDDDNLRISMQQCRRPLSYSILLSRLQNESGYVFPLTVLTVQAGDLKRELELKGNGWNVLVIPKENVFTITGPQIKANADFDLAFELGHLVNSIQFDTVLLGTGDGDLAVAVGRGIRRTCPRIRLLTLSVPASTSTRLRTRPDLFDGNIAVGCNLSSHQNLQN